MLERLEARGAKIRDSMTRDEWYWGGEMERIYWSVERSAVQEDAVDNTTRAQRNWWFVGFQGEWRSITWTRNFSKYDKGRL